MEEKRQSRSKQQDDDNGTLELRQQERQCVRALGGFQEIRVSTGEAALSFLAC
jgi:hypothetical protein